MMAIALLVGGYTGSIGDPGFSVVVGVVPSGGKGNDVGGPLGLEMESSLGRTWDMVRSSVA